MAAICRSRALPRGFWRKFRAGWWRIWGARRRGLSFRVPIMGLGMGALIRRLIRRQTALAEGMPRLASGTTAMRMRIRAHHAGVRTHAGLATGANSPGSRVEVGRWTILRASLRREG